MPEAQRDVVAELKALRLYGMAAAWGDLQDRGGSTAVDSGRCRCFLDGRGAFRASAAACARMLRPEPPDLERGGAAANCVNITRESRLSKNLPGQKFRREEKCERKPSGCPFAFNHPPQRQNCKIMLQDLILQFGKQLGEKARRDFF